MFPVISRCPGTALRSAAERSAGLARPIRSKLRGVRCIRRWAAGILLLGVLLLNGRLSVSRAEEPVGKLPAPQFAPTDWPWWRGPQRNGVASADQQPPTSWSPTQNVVWSLPVAGRGHGSPIVVGDQVVLATADLERQQQSVLCVDRRTGQRVWETVVHSGGLTDKGNEKSSLASGTLACDGERFFVNFLNSDAAWTTALDRSGQQLWQQKITDYVLHQGFGSSPAVYQDLVLVSADNKGGGAIAGLHRATGQVVWKHGRPAKPNYTSPIILSIAGRDQLLLTGCDLVTSLNPLTGEVLWEIEGATTECVTSTVTDGTHIFTSGGYPKNHMSAVAADGSGKVVWENTTRSYVPSMLEKDGYLYVVLDAGIATCWRSATGEEVWKARLGGTFSSSPVLVGDLIYATNEDGETSIFKASPEAFELVGRNDLGDSVFSTPTICGNRIYARVGVMQDGRRQEILYCIGQ